MIEFRQVKAFEKVVEYLASTIEARLSKGQSVLWLIAGGSAMDIAVKTADKLKGNQGLAKLTISLTDERYGQIGHSDSNWQLLQEKKFSVPGARLVPILLDKKLEETVGQYERFLNQQLREVDFSIALAGMGADGHIFGIKPSSPAVNSGDTVVGYEWDDFVRITPTINLIERLDEVIIYAVGEEKHRQIDKLIVEGAANTQPAQLLKRLKNVVFFNDYKGEEI